jgi:hypothetical protein
LAELFNLRKFYLQVFKFGLNQEEDPSKRSPAKQLPVCSPSRRECLKTQEQLSYNWVFP